MGRDSSAEERERNEILGVQIRVSGGDGRRVGRREAAAAASAADWGISAGIRGIRNGLEEAPWGRRDLRAPDFGRDFPPSEISAPPVGL